jgi:uroporphyrin-III C-methyltransferase
MRKLLESRFGPEWAEWIEAAARFRQTVRSLHLAGAEQEKLFDRFFESTVDAEQLKARVPTEDEQAGWLRAVPNGTANGADAPTYSQPEIADSKPDRESGIGFVSLVGAGPGDAGLLTVRGRQRMLAADAVVYDNLAVTALPCDLPADIELRCVGKQAGHHPVPQEEINNLLVRLAREGKRVVRLKGGDPYVFGRGGEEAEALAAAGISFEVVPAVTAGVAVPTYAGIPVTHRREVVRLTMVTAHETTKAGGPQVRWDLLGKDPHATLIGYMGVTRLPVVVDELLSAGMNPYTPAAMIERGTTPRQRVVRASLAQLPEAVEKAGLHPPGLFVIGPTVRHASILDWFTKLPLFGLRLVMVAPAGELGEALELGGAKVVEVPMSVTPAARAVMGAQALTACIFKDADEVDALDEERDGPGWGPKVVAWCLTAQAADRARQLGWARVEELTGPATPADLAARLKQVHRPRTRYSTPKISST